MIAVPLVPVRSTLMVAARPPYRTPVYALLLECGHTAHRRLGDGPIPARVRCKACVDA